MRVPSIECTAEKFARLLCWMWIPQGPPDDRGARCETVDWEKATPKEMEEWRKEFVWTYGPNAD